MSSFLSSSLIAFLLPISSTLIVFSFLSFAAWSGDRAKERQAFYRNELLKKIADSTSGQAESILEMMREEERNVERRRREGLKLGGLIWSGVGAGLTALMAALAPGTGVWALGLIPLLVGVALLVYAFLLAPRIPA